MHQNRFVSFECKKCFLLINKLTNRIDYEGQSTTTTFKQKDSTQMTQIGYINMKVTVDEQSDNCRMCQGYNTSICHVFEDQNHQNLLSIGSVKMNQRKETLGIYELNGTQIIDGFCVTTTLPLKLAKLKQLIIQCSKNQLVTQSKLLTFSQLVSCKC